MRFLTLNTHSWCEPHQIVKIRELARFIAHHRVDVIALQEVNQYLHSPIVDTPLGYQGGPVFLSARIITHFCSCGSWLI